MPLPCCRALLPLAALLAVAAPCSADEFQDDEQAVQLRVERAGDVVAVSVRAPLNSLIGFAHRPRTVAHFQAAQTLLQLLQAPQSLLHLDDAAQCTLTASTVDAPLLMEASATLAAVSTAWQADPADPKLDASFEFRCAHPDQLTNLEVSVFDAFERVQRIDTQVTGSDKETSQRLVRPQRIVRLAP